MLRGAYDGRVWPAVDRLMAILRAPDAMISIYFDVVRLDTTHIPSTVAISQLGPRISNLAN